MLLASYQLWSWKLKEYVTHNVYGAGVIVRRTPSLDGEIVSVYFYKEKKIRAVYASSLEKENMLEGV